MDRFETRRLALKALVDGLGRGGRAEVAKRIEKEASYVSRLLYPPGKDGRKRIGDELMEALTRAYPSWMDGAPKPGKAAAAPASAPRARRRDGYIQFSQFGAARADGLPPVVETLELATWEVQRRLGYLPEPGRIQLVTHVGPSMRPILDDGDIVFVDTTVTEFAGDDCYLIGMGDDVQVKLLQRRGADVWVVSQNPDFPAWRAAEGADIMVRGKIVLRASLRTI